MNRYVTFLILSLSSLLNAQNYIPDPEFSQNGYEVTNYNSYYDNDQAPKNVHFVNNKYIFAQKTQLSCFTNSGSVDYTFGTSGYARVIMPGYDITIKSSKIVGSNVIVYGKAASFSNNDFYAFIAKFSVDGIPDTTFGTNGLVKFYLGNKYAHADYSSGITDLIYKDSNYFAIGTIISNDTSIRNVFMVKLDANGTLDNTLDPSGIKKYTFDNAHMADKIFEYENDLLIIGSIAHYGNINPEQSTTLMKIDENGNPVTAFGNNGLKKIILVNYICSCGETMTDCNVVGNDLYYKKFYANSMSSGTGIQKIDMSTLQDVNNILSMNPTYIATFCSSGNGKYFIEGDKVYILSPSDGSQNCGSNFTLSRRFTDGTLDTSFNQTGFYSFNFPSPTVDVTHDNASVFIKTDDKILIGGYTSVASYTTAPNTGFAMLRIGNAVLASDNFNGKDQLSIYPNPARDYIILHNPQNLAIEKAIIADTTGKVVYEGVGNKEQIDISNLSTGIYIMTIYSQNKTQSFKIIKSD